MIIKTFSAFKIRLVHVNCCFRLWVLCDSLAYVHLVNICGLLLSPCLSRYRLPHYRKTGPAAKISCWTQAIHV